MVHREYGIGKFNSLKKISTKDMTFDCLELIYKNNDKVHLPVENIELLSLYSHSNNDQIELDKLGSAQWQVRKNKASNNIKEIAAELIKQEAKKNYPMLLSLKQIIDIMSLSLSLNLKKQKIS